MKLKRNNLNPVGVQICFYVCTSAIWQIRDRVLDQAKTQARRQVTYPVDNQVNNQFIRQVKNQINETKKK